MHNSSPLTGRLILIALVAGIAVITVPACGGQVINEDLKLLASDGAVSDWFGVSTGIDNGIVAVGSFGDDDNGGRSGSAYLFNAFTGDQIAKLLPGDGAAGDSFGFSVAINNGVVVVGSVLDDDNGSNSGSAYLFDAVTGVQIAKLLPSDGAVGDQFGYSVAIDNGIVAVGADGDEDNGDRSGSTYLFDASTGAQIAKLLPSDGSAGDRFGFSIAIGDGVVAVGAHYNDDNGADSGSAYLFNASTGAQITKLLPSDGAADDWFGYSVAVDNGFVAVGAYSDDDNGRDSGSVYLFNASTGTQIAKLLPSDGAENDHFSEVAIDNGIVAVGTWGDDDNGSASGSAYLFDVSTGTQIAKLLPSDGAANDYFSESIAIDNGVVAVGAVLDDDNGGGSGSAYVFNLCPADFNSDGIVNTLDFIAYLNAYNVNDPRADMNGDGIVNTLDFLEFLNAYNEGC